MRGRKVIYVATTIILCLTQCKPEKKHSIETLIKVDKEFSEYSLDKGIARAFLKYCAKDAVVIQDSSMPVVGIHSISKLYDTTKTSEYLLSWQPLDGSISKSGDLGYTYGTWFLFKKNNDSTHLAEGCYVTIWKKNENGNWKWALDTGTDGLGQ